MEEVQQNLGQVQAKHVDAVMTALNEMRREVKSDYDDVIEAMNKLESLFNGDNKIAEISKVTLAIWDIEEEPPKVDVSMFSAEKSVDIQEHINTVSAGLSYLYSISTWLSKQSTETGLIKDVKVPAVNEQQTTGVQVQQKSIWGRIADAFSVSVERRAAKKVVALHESQFARIEFVYNRWEVFTRQYYNKFVPIMTELGRRNNEPAMIMLMQRNLRNFRDVRRIILSVLPLGYRLDVDAKLAVLAKAAETMNAANAQSLQAAAAMAPRPLQPSGGGG